MGFFGVSILNVTIPNMHYLNIVLFKCRKPVRKELSLMLFLLTLISKLYKKIYIRSRDVSVYTNTKLQCLQSILVEINVFDLKR